MNEVIPADVKHHTKNVEASGFNPESTIVEPLSGIVSKSLYLSVWFLLAGFSFLVWAVIITVIF
jgi:hypothetical protein